MKEINIARTIVTKRREKGMTQDELASFMGVSKASVSKWETGQSYPDIVFLPQLATFFNITMDELMGYEPQMSKEDIRKLYHTLSADFAALPFNEVMAHCREIIKKYYACFPLLFQMGNLLTNYSALSNDAEKTTAILAEAKSLFKRVRQESGDVSLSKLALHVEAVCCLARGEAEEVLSLLDGKNEVLTYSESLLASAYHMKGNAQKAKDVLQVGTYQHLLALLDILISYLSLCTDEPKRFTEIYQRILVILETFQCKTLHPSIMMTFYLVAAQGFAALGDQEESIRLLELYTELVTGDIYPLELTGDAFFDALHDWLDEAILVKEAPRDEKTVRRSMADAVIQNPAFAAFKQMYRFQRIVERLQQNCQVN